MLRRLPGFNCGGAGCIYDFYAILVPRMAWIVETLNAAVDAEVNALPVDMRAHLVRISFMIQEFGLARVHEPHVKHLEGPLWEMRMRGRDGISRALYVAAKGHRVVIVRVFVKKTQKTPRREIDLALSRVKEVLA
ncbi:MAG: type II toxin-antitoxin system RelE/ParE family toxin [Acetobacteraceae bacterium]